MVSFTPLRAETLADQEEISIGAASPPSDRGLFIAHIQDNTADQNFAQQNIKVEMTAPATLSSPVCTKGGINTDPFNHKCVFEQDTLEVRIRFSNYNYPTCSHLGNKWAYDTETSQCVLPPKNKNDAPDYALAEIRNFALCSLSTPSGALKIIDRQVTNGGTTTEYTEFTIGRNGAATLWAALSGIFEPTFNADFKQTCP
mgnify:CR=1 FL=1